MTTDAKSVPAAANAFTTTAQPDPGYSNGLACRDGVKTPKAEPATPPLVPGWSNERAVRD